MLNRTAAQSLLLLLLGASSLVAEELQRVAYHHPGLTVDLGVGLWAWPMPMDYDRDGDLDLVVSCPDAPYRGTYFFENTGRKDGVFAAGVRIADAMPNVQVSYTGDEPVVMAPGVVFDDFRTNQYARARKLPLPKIVDPRYKKVRANQWTQVDYDGDGVQDLVIGHGFWDDYGWDNAWNEQGEWQNGPLHGFVYWAKNIGSNESPEYAPPQKVLAGGQPVDVYGMPSPNFADFDGDGDLDLLCGEFLDGFTYFENAGTRTVPEYRSGVRVQTVDAGSGLVNPLAMDLQMITPSAIDWDGDGDIDLVCGDEDGRVALIRNTGGLANGAPAFESPRYFQQEAADVKFGALVNPCAVDWDGDGDDDLVCGNTAGQIALVENLGEHPPRWARPKLLEEKSLFSRDVLIEGPIRHAAGPNGSIQGPCEAKWGYTAVSAGDWDHDGLTDLVVNDIWGQVCWYRRTAADPAAPLEQNLIRVAWEGDVPKPAWTWWTPDPGMLATQWRTTPCVADWNRDGLNDLVMLDHEGYLALYERAKAPENEADVPDPETWRPGGLTLLPPRRIFKITGPSEFDGNHRPLGEARDGLLRLNGKIGGGSGRRKLHVVDWDGDGDLDLLVNSLNVNLLRNERTDDDGSTWFMDEGPLDTRKLAGHDTAPTTVDWDGNGVPDLLVGAEDGYLYYKRRPDTEPTGGKGDM